LSAQLGGNAAPVAPRSDPAPRGGELRPVPAPSAPAAPLVGRESEMLRLRLMANEARAQRSGRVALLVGEPGMGKTRLFEELRYALRDPAPCMLDAVAHEAERNRPLAPF